MLEHVSSTRTAELTECSSFLESGDSYKNHCSEANRKKILAPFEVPDFLSNQTCTDLNGYLGSQSSFPLKMATASLKVSVLSLLFSSKQTATHCATHIGTWFRILTKKVLTPEEGKVEMDKDYLWFEMGFFMRWKGVNANRVLCIGVPRETSNELRTTLMAPTSPSLNPKDPFAMLRPLFDEVVKLCDDCTWRMMKLVRSIELVRPLIRLLSVYC